MDPNRLAGKRCLITGAAQGMGAAIAEYWAAQGAQVGLCDINLDGCNAVAERIGQVAASSRVPGFERPLGRNADIYLEGPDHRRRKVSDPGSIRDRRWVV